MIQAWRRMLVVLALPGQLAALLEGSAGMLMEY